MELNNSDMVKQMTEFQTTDILLIFMILMVCSFFIVEEKSKGMFFFLRPLKFGRGRLMAGKIMALLAVTAVVTVFFFVENYLISGFQYGFARLELPLQTIAGYTGSALHMTVGEYLLLYLISKTAAAFIIGLFCFLFSLTAKAIPVYYIKMAAFLGISWLFYAAAPSGSLFQILKYVNIIPFLRVTPIYQYYFNLNAAGLPAAMTAIFWGMSIACILAVSVVLTVCFSRQERVAFSERRRSRKRQEHKRIHVGVFYHECYKIFVTNRVGLILLLFLAVQCYGVAQTSTYLPFDEYYYREYMTALEGKLDQSRLELIEKEEQRFAYYDEMLAEAYQKLEAGEITWRELEKTEELVRQQTKGRGAFERVLERREYLLQYQEEQGQTLDFVYEGGWDSLFGRGYTMYENDMIRAAALLIVMIIAFVGVFGMEFSTQMINLMVCCKYGRMHTAVRKLLICAGITTLLFALTYLPDIVNAFRIYGLHGWGSSIYSIPSLADFPLPLNICSYLLLLFAIRYLMVFCVLGMILAASLYTKSMSGAVFPLLFLLVLPLFVDLLGVNLIRNVSLNRFLTGNGYLDSIAGNGWMSLSILFPIFLGAAGIQKMRKRFRE